MSKTGLGFGAAAQLARHVARIGSTRCLMEVAREWRRRFWRNGREGTERVGAIGSDDPFPG